MLRIKLVFCCMLHKSATIELCSQPLYSGIVWFSRQFSWRKWLPWLKGFKSVSPVASWSVPEEWVLQTESDLYPSPKATYWQSRSHSRDCAEWSVCSLKTSQQGCWPVWNVHIIHSGGRQVGWHPGRVVRCEISQIWAALDMIYGSYFTGCHFQDYKTPN